MKTYFRNHMFEKKITGLEWYLFLDTNIIRVDNKYYLHIFQLRINVKSKLIVRITRWKFSEPKILKNVFEFTDNEL